jgi:general secretion pathway protein G
VSANNPNSDVFGHDAGCIRRGIVSLLNGDFVSLDGALSRGFTMGAGAVNARERTALPGACARGDRSVRSVGTLGRAGFTLVELMIAIAIIAVLVAIAVPSYESYRDRVLVAQAKSDIIGLGVDIARYVADNMRLPDSLADIGKAAMLDPWNHPYQYLNLTPPLAHGHAGKVRKDKSLHPLNSDYDLCSMGKDGNSAAALTAKASRDDIIRASDGRFVGLASDY